MVSVECRIYAVATLGVAVVGSFATQPASAAVATGSSASARDLLFKVKTPENEGDEGDEGNEGLDNLRSGMFAMMTTSEGSEGDEGDEGNEGDEGDEGDEGGAPVPVDDNNEGDEGDEGDEGNEGDEGGEVIRTTGSTFSQVYCASKATADSFTVSRSAHVVATVEAVADACAPDFDGSTVKIEKLYYDAGLVIADAFADSQAACVSAGNAFGCASASATATAWAQATAEAHATAYAQAIDECVCLKTNAGTLAIGVASTFVELVADAFARAEVTACASGDAEAYAKAWTSCSASAYARVWTQALASAMVSADCFAEASTSIIAATKSEFTVIEGCQRFDESLGDASGSTDGSTAEGQANEN